MDDAVRMQVLQPRQDLPRVHRHHRLCEGTELLQERGDRAPGHQLEEDIELILLSKES